MSNPVLPVEARDHRERGWFWANDEIIDRYGYAIGADGIAVYMALARYADRNGQCWPSYATIAERLWLSRPTVIKCLARLVLAGLVTSTTRTKSGKSGGERPDSNLYTLLTVRPLSDDERIALREAVKISEGSKGALPPIASNGHSKGALPSPTSKGALPHLVKEIDQGSKGALPGVVKELVQKETQLNQTHDSSSNRSRERNFLRKVGFYNGAIDKILALDIDWPTLEASIVALSSAGWGVGAIYNELKDNPPMKGHPYEQPQSGLGSPAAQAGATRPMPRSPERARRSAGSHNPTGGAELHNPGWQQKELDRIQKLYNIPDSEM